MTNNQKRWTSQRAGIKALFDKGLTYAEIGAEFGITRQRVQQVLDKFYKVRRRKSYTRPHKVLDKKGTGV